LLLLRSGPELKISTTMRVLHIAGLAIIFAVVRSTTSTASGQRWANKPYETPGGYTRPPTMRPNVHAPRLHKREAPILVGPILAHRARPENFHGFLIGPSPPFPLHSQPESTETMTDDHPEHHHRPRPVITQKPGPISETPLVTSEAASEEHTMPPVMTEDNAMMPSEELTNAPESNEAIIEEISEHDEMISIHEFKEVLHELVKDAVDKIVMKKAGIVGKLKTAKQNLIGHVGEATSRDPQQLSSFCECDTFAFDSRGRGNCNSHHNGQHWCYLQRHSHCPDQRRSMQLPGRFHSHLACFISVSTTGPVHPANPGR